ncbi:hypothetical protein, partial [Salipiger marinus]|uniref:hypothetical protein n=1 Tax=Salipiger marinus TaxID=555512 RepID=UPI004058FD23
QNQFLEVMVRGIVRHFGFLMAKEPDPVIKARSKTSIGREKAMKFLDSGPKPSPKANSDSSKPSAPKTDKSTRRGKSKPD